MNKYKIDKDKLGAYISMFLICVSFWYFVLRIIFS